MSKIEEEHGKLKRKRTRSPNKRGRLQISVVEEEDESEFDESLEDSVEEQELEQIIEEELKGQMEPTIE